MKILTNKRYQELLVCEKIADKARDLLCQSRFIAFFSIIGSYIFGDDKTVQNIVDEFSAEIDLRKGMMVEHNKILREENQKLREENAALITTLKSELIQEYEKNKSVQFED